MGVIKRLVEAAVDPEDFDAAWAQDGNVACAHCKGQWGPGLEFTSCADCVSARICSECMHKCGSCGAVLCPSCADGITEVTEKALIHAPSWTHKSCAECRAPLCHSCRPGALRCDRQCASCDKALCMGLGRSGSGEECGEACISCAKLTCKECSLMVYEECGVGRKCIDCVTRRNTASSSDSKQKLESPVPSTPPKRQRIMRQTTPAEKSRVLRRAYSVVIEGSIQPELCHDPHQSR
eukprot:gnl/MRDRNA2_/MRDRNA2_115272_c0_seq1.p1 gnl/MRDRNA2_/MRDRNA2_115272_c0~~gnl/MRDRNA2_/MRDRNA2_115272_c0_seq1.p1  ORF type:complete len:237 (-),score=28.28 gnl/MRDRNA2_/MRDRNA2_115272_c0_seq1:255-965(-)